MGLFGFGKKEKDKMKDGLEKTRTGFWGNILNTLTGSKIDDDLSDSLEEQLILADVGGEVAIKLVDKLRDRVNEKGLKTGEQAADELRDLIAEEMQPEAEMALDGHPAVILVIGVNGVGKTTSIAKLADYYTRQGRKVMLAAGDTFRAAASEQLEIWADRAGVPLVKAGEGADPAAVIFDTVKSATARGYDLVIADTAGRLHINEELMGELRNIKAAVSPHEILLVVDAMTVQDAVTVAESFNNDLGIDGLIVTKLDGDARGGAVLSVKAVTGRPVKFVGMGEKLDALEPFYPDRMASRILGMGDMLTFIEKAEQQYDEKQAKKLEEKLRKNRLTLTDYLDQMEQLQSMGDLSQIADMLPGGMAKGFDPSQIDEKQMAHNKAIIQSMTPLERENPQILNASRKKRIAAGCGLEVVDVNRLLKSFEMLQQMTKAMTKGGGMRGLGGMMGGFGGKVARGALHGFGRKKRLK